MMKKYCVTFAALVCLLSLVSNDATPVPRLINYQGVLIDTSGAVMTGTHDLTFAIYADTSQSALALWSETHTGVDIDDGLFNAILGEITEIPDTLFVSQDRWIGISVDAEPGDDATSADHICAVDVSRGPCGFRGFRRLGQHSPDAGGLCRWNRRYRRRRGRPLPRCGGWIAGGCGVRG